METNWVDFRAVKNAVTMRMALDHYQVNWLRKKDDELRGRCPIHNGEGQHTFHANLEKNAFHCFSCKARGNVLDFVAAMEKCSVREAALKLQEWYLITPTDVDTQAARVAEPTESRGEPPAKNEPLKFQLKGVDPAHPYLASRGISKETAEEFGIGFYSGKGSMSGRIVIPIHDEHGTLLAYAGRAIDDSEPKYKLPGGFHKSLVLYNLQRLLKCGDKKVSTLVLVEGFFGCIKVHEAGHPCAALMGSSLSVEQEALICSNFERVVILFDGDEAGRKGTEDCLLRLGRKLWLKTVGLPEGKQPDQLRNEELHELLEI